MPLLDPAVASLFPPLSPWCRFVTWVLGLVFVLTEFLSPAHLASCWLDVASLGWAEIGQPHTSPQFHSWFLGDFKQIVVISGYEFLYL